MTEPDDTNVFTDQAKWLIEWHNRRSESTTARATALLGFTGVTLALLLQGTRLPGINPNAFIWLVLALTVAALFATAFCCIRALRTIEVTVANSHQLRQWWQKYNDDTNPASDDYQRNITETFLSATDLQQESPIDTAKNAADNRSWWFGWATWALAATVVFISVLLFAILIQQQGR
ncbi:hypothetical protein [Nocardioides aurantiacus]|uniref:SMODS and SLOG-associating 2TM effector domain-containing protein n=1 Tax=Nocardioides aurantiacus TaxID=86796 RepID=A0A3N2CTR7_9ACTN|nr:hypothetical protein [Nocardioides aurantiacus]ROR90929.1 hypothetical protein EDD33_1785 [Nocardioides aurantiacus]